jgi:isopenicillin-N epimerase
VTRPSRSALASHWTLDPDITFLNHGSFGATPRSVLEKQTELRARLEREPVKFMVRELESMLDAARSELAEFVGADPQDVAFVSNATTGVNAVLRSLHLEAGDELITTTHEYNACRNALDFVADRAGARVVAVDIPLPVRSEDEIAARILEAVGRRTRLILIDHVTSPTAIVMPIAKIAHECGVPILVDGAHGPGQVEVDLSALGVSFYTANCHKWMCAPKGCAMLWVRHDLQPSVRPAVISHGANSPRTDRCRFLLEFDWMGTLDPTPWLCVGDSIRAIGAMVPGGWPEVRARNHALAVEARKILLDAVGGEPICPASMLGAMAAVKIADGGMELGDILFEKHGIEVPIVPFPCAGKRLVRVSAHLYNTREEYALLAAALPR